MDAVNLLKDGGTAALIVVSSAPIATGLLTGLVGFLTPFITQAVKKRSQLKGRWPVVLTAGVSISLGSIVVGVAFLTGEATNWRDIITLAPWVFSEATLLYHLGMPVDLNIGPPVELKQSKEQEAEVAVEDAKTEVK